MPLDDETPKFDKSKLPSRHVSVGPASAPHQIGRASCRERV